MKVKAAIFAWIVLLGCLAMSRALASSATWTGAQNGIYSNTNNWTPTNVPNAQSDTATFGASATTTLTVSPVQVGTLNFLSGAPAYTFNVDSLGLYASGIVNNSSNTQTFNITTVLQFANSTDAGTNVAINVGTAGDLAFTSSSTADAATIVATGGGKTTFSSTSTAGTANITANTGSSTVFNNTTASSSTLNADGTNTKIVFNGTATAASSTITNTNSARAIFNNTSTAASSTIVNSSSAKTIFNNSTTAGSASITNNALASTVFNNSSTASTATLITNSGGTNVFNNTSTAATALITNNSGGTTSFNNTTTAASATITNNTGGKVLFFGSATAGSSAIANSGTVAFNVTSDGGTATITSTSGTLDISNSAGIGLGALNGNGSVLLGNQNLDLGAGNLDSSFSGVISDTGSGSFTKQGTGTVTLSGANTYAGGTTVDSGLLDVTGSITHGAADTVVGVTSGLTSELDIESGASVTDNNGTIGSGSTTLSTVKVSGGTWTNNGNITVGDNGNGTLLIKQGGTVSGGTVTIAKAVGSVGLLQVGNGDGGNALTATSVVFGAGAGTLALDQTDSITFGAPISGSGTFLQEGSGTTTLGGANGGFSGSTLISGGKLEIASATALGSSNVTVSGSGILSTDGVSVTKINVGGNYSQTGGQLVLSIFGPTTNSNESLQVSGTTTLGATSTLALTFPNGGFTVTPNLSYDLVHSTGGLTGQFSSLTGMGNFTIPAGYFTMVNYTGTDVILTFRQFLSQLSSLTPNQQSIGTYLDQYAVAVTGGNFGALVTQIYPLSTNPTELASALNQLSPQVLQVFDHVSFDNATFNNQLVNNHLTQLRDGLTGFDGSQLTYTDSSLSPMLSQVKGRLLAWNPAVTPGFLSDVVDPVMEGVSNLGRYATSSLLSEDRWSTFIAGNVILADLNHNQDLTHQDYTTGSVTMGADYRIDRNWTVGALFGYGHTEATLDHMGSNSTVDTYSPGVYASYVDGGWYGNGLFSYGYNDYEENRNIQIGTLSGTNHGTPNGNQFVGNLTGGYEFREGAWKIGPMGNLQYANLGVNPFQEQGPTALNINAQSAESFRSQLGFTARCTGHVQGWFGSYNLTPHFSGTWQHEFLDDSRGITSQFNQVGAGSFTVMTSSPDRDSAVLDFGIDAQINKNITLFTDYATQVGQDNFFAQSVQAGLKIEF